VLPTQVKIFQPGRCRWVTIAQSVFLNGSKKNNRLYSNNKTKFYNPISALIEKRAKNFKIFDCENFNKKR
jgi:hypothetical protein